MEEAARIAILERKERLNMLIEKNKTYLSRKERKFLKNKLNIINGKAPKGIYFDYNRIDFMFRVLDEDKISIDDLQKSYFRVLNMKSIINIT